MGIGFVLPGGRGLFDEGSTGRLVMSTSALAFVVVGALGARWTPLALTPRWFRAQVPGRR